MWLGKVMNSVDLGGACKKKYVGKAQHIKGTRYDGGTGASPSCGLSASPFESRKAITALIFQQH